jgi:hypothetical protein
MEHPFDIDFGTESLRSIPLLRAAHTNIFSCPSGDFHRKIWDGAQKSAQLNRNEYKGKSIAAAMVAYISRG